MLAHVPSPSDKQSRLSRSDHADSAPRSNLRARGEPDTTAVALPDWAVEQLTDLLSTVGSSHVPQVRRGPVVHHP